MTRPLGDWVLMGYLVVEFLIRNFAVASKAISEGCQHPIPRLKKDKVKRGYAHHGKTENLGVWKTVVAKTKDEWTFIHISFPSEDPSDSDVEIV